MFVYEGSTMSIFVFPVQNWTGATFRKAPLAFGSNRGVRKHAGCDLYSSEGSEVYSVTNGRVIEISRNFIKSVPGIHAVAVDHGVHGVARYCELHLNPEIKIGMVLESGQVIGKIAKLEASGHSFPSDMLHFELYSGKGKGSLTNLKNMPFQRRSDLVDPSDFLDRIKAMKAFEDGAADVLKKVYRVVTFGYGGV